MISTDALQVGFLSSLTIVNDTTSLIKTIVIQNNFKLKRPFLKTNFFKKNYRLEKRSFRFRFFVVVFITKRSLFQKMKNELRRQILTFKTRKVLYTIYRGLRKI